MTFSRILWSVLACALFYFLAACAAVGGVMQSVGGGLTDYSKKEEGFVSRVAGVAGEVYTIVGTAVKGEAQSSSTSSSTPSARPAPSTAQASSQAPASGTPGPAVERTSAPLHSSPRASGGTNIGGDASVLEAQRILLALGYDVGKPDGLFGRRTSSALKQYQTSVGLSSNGAIDPKTMAALRSSAAAGNKSNVESSGTLKQSKELEAVKGSLGNL